MHIDSIFLLEKAIKIDNKTRRQLDLKFIEEIGELAASINKKEPIDRVFEESVDCFIVFCQYYSHEGLSKILCSIHKNKANKMKITSEELVFWYQSKMLLSIPTRECIQEVYNLLVSVGPFDKVFEEKVRKYYCYSLSKDHNKSYFFPA